jgi:hypothetical protein
VEGSGIGRARPRQRCEGDGTLGRDEEVLDLDVVAARAAHAERVPVVDDPRLVFREDREQADRLAVLTDARHTVVVHVGYAHDPRRGVDVAVKAAAPAHPVAVSDRNRATGWEKTAGQNGVAGSEDLGRRLVREPGS